MLEKVTVIWIQSVLEALPVDLTTVKQIIRRPVVTGIVLPIAVLRVSNDIYNFFVELERINNWK